MVSDALSSAASCSDQKDQVPEEPPGSFVSLGS